MVRLNVSMSEKVLKVLDNRAENLGISRSEMLRSLIIKELGYEAK